MLLVIFLIIFSICTISIIKKRENFKIQYLAPLDKRSIQENNTKQLPWCQKWNHCRKSNLKCYVNRHLQRKCIWTC